MPQLWAERSVSLAQEQERIQASTDEMLIASGAFPSRREANATLKSPSLDNGSSNAAVTSPDAPLCVSPMTVNVACQLALRPASFGLAHQLSSLVADASSLRARCPAVLTIPTLAVEDSELIDPSDLPVKLQLTEELAKSKRVEQLLQRMRAGGC